MTQGTTLSQAPQRDHARELGHPSHDYVAANDAARARPVMPPPLPHVRPQPPPMPAAPQRYAPAAAHAAPERRPARQSRAAGRAAAGPERRRSAWLWGLAGFVLGMVFWHLIGFWGFINTVLLTPGTRERPVVERPQSGELRMVPGTAPPVRAVGPARSTTKGGAAAQAHAQAQAAANAPPVGSVSWGAVVQSTTVPDAAAD